MFFLLVVLISFLCSLDAFALSMVARGPQTNKLNPPPTPKFNPAEAKKEATKIPEKKLKTKGIGGFMNAMTGGGKPRQLGGPIRDATYVSPITGKMDGVKKDNKKVLTAVEVEEKKMKKARFF